MLLPRARQDGFTIVELLIVIVIIGVLAGIVIVAYTGITKRAQDSNAKASFSELKKVVEMYQVDNGSYPKFCPTDGLGCWINVPTAAETSIVVPKYSSDTPKFEILAQYVADGPGTSYGFYLNLSTGACKYLSEKAPASWWGAVPLCNFN